MQTVTDFLDEWATAERTGDAVVVVAKQTGKGDYQGTPVPEAARASLVLVPADDRWRLVGLHLSFIAGTPGAPPLPAAAAGRTEEGDSR